MSSEAALWHEVECGGYRADLGLWEGLVRRYGSPVLDVGAGSGRVTLALAGAGASVVAIDTDRDLLAELADRAKARGLGGIETVCADARRFRRPAAFALAIVPMQTVQLLGGPAGRAEFLECMRESLQPGGCLAVAVADMSGGATAMPAEYPADVLRFGERTYESRPTCVRSSRAKLVIERRRSRTGPDGSVSEGTFTEEIDRIEPAEMEAEGVAFGFSPAGRLKVSPTGAYAGSEVVLLNG